MNLNSLARIVWIAAAILPFVLMTLLSGRINLERKHRGHQFLLPLIAVIYCCVMMFAVNGIAISVVKLTRFLSRTVSYIPLAGRSLQKGLDVLADCFSVGYGIQLTANTVIMAGFCMVKGVLLPIVKKWWGSWEGLYRFTSGRFYIERKGRSILRDRYADMRFYFLIMYFVAVALGGVDCILSLLVQQSPVFLFPLYPVFGIIVLGEISFFLDGETVDESERAWVKPGEEDEKGDAFEELMRAEEMAFGDRVLLADYVPPASADKKQHDWEQELSGRDYLDEIAGAYFTSLPGRGVSINADYVTAARSLLHGKSVLIYNPFYRDVTDYIMLPVFHELLNHKRILVVCGRAMNEDDVGGWIRGGVSAITNLPKMWKIGSLGETTNGTNVLDVGILGFRKLYDIHTLSANMDFFRGVSFAVILEPSNLLGTGQIGLRTIVHLCEGNHKKVTYLALGRNADGLIDALSHVVRQPITEAVAAPVAEAGYYRMMWRAEGPGVQDRILPRISHYFGLGGEIGALAMHEGAGNIHWYAGSKMPLTDLRWNVEQYYAPICMYIDSPREQFELDTRFLFHESLWQAKEAERSFTIVEDEFNNLFDISRTFASRETKHGFVNVISASYLLRDYMCANDVLFSNDPKAIPSIVPDYAHTERNFVIRMLTLMAVCQVKERELSRELSLQGCETRFPYEKFISFVRKYTETEDVGIRKIQNNERTRGQVFLSSAFVADKAFVESVFDSALRPAFYVVENEKTDVYMMGNRLMGQVEQALLPGQFFCFEGRYYQVRRISPESGIVVRRAGDHLNGRFFYRQLRSYSGEGLVAADNPKELRGIHIQLVSANLEVETDGYYIMEARHLLQSASVVKLEHKISRRLSRKDVLKIIFPEITDGVLFTLCNLFNELFQTIYPNDADYIVAAVANKNRPDAGDDLYDRLRALVPTFEAGDDTEKAIYFIEDSHIDLGILVSIERNLQRFLEIIMDYLDWYLDPDRERIGDEDDLSGEGEGGTASGGGMEGLYRDTVGSDIDGEDESLYDGASIHASARFRNVEYLTYGYGKEPEWLCLKETLQYLGTRRFDDSSLHRARKGGNGDAIDYVPYQPGIHYCDFCGKQLESGKYIVLRDGRERCKECSDSAVRTVKQFKEVYRETLSEMERIFGIRIQVSIKVRMVNARKVNDHPSFKKYVPSPGFDPRVLGYACQKGDSYLIMVENGAPLWKMKSTLVHELTHIWQYTNWAGHESDLTGKSGMDRDVIVEGMAVWAEVQYLMSMGRTGDSVRYRKNREADKTEYGTGMIRYIKKYPIREAAVLKTRKTPFGKIPPLS